jgi:hypothetical protein
MKYYHTSPQLAEGPVVIYNAALKHTSSWANTYLDRDHHAAAAHAEETAPEPGTPGDLPPAAPQQPSKGTSGDGS